ncbi:wyosine base formation domain-containing protein [Nocardioides sp. Root122]|uniref:TIGR03084 family metal-binding protein n=1 Tax=Nocardioides TaxID=1839 RepID=UPI0007023E55|nr:MULTISPECIES: TIGR03084 family metal-binding protein [Nocardioides]KQV77423.1 wyosine base formation domain-containing protein [Nocardioides sp. Root122]MCK9826006.1 TIGR03084 family metal-binding protein [Nocardioides cavernae]
MTDVLTQVLADLAAEGDRLDAVVAGLDDAGWHTPTPAAGWDVADQVAHLAWTDGVALRAATDKAAWDEVVLEAIADPEGFVDAQAHALAAEPDLLARWRSARSDLHAALATYPSGEKMPWFGPPMSATSMATARLMETWAHSLDVHEALGAPVEDTDRIRHIAHLGVRTRNFAHQLHGLDVPTEEFRIDLVSPSGDVWAWGPEDATQTLTGSAGDFCRLVTQRVNRADTDLVATGADVDRWLDVAQAFAGQPGEGRAPR